MLHGVILPLRIVGFLVVHGVVAGISLISVMMRLSGVLITVRIVAFFVVLGSRCVMVPGKGRRSEKCRRVSGLQVLIPAGSLRIRVAVDPFMLYLVRMHVLDGRRGSRSSWNHVFFRFLRLALG